MTIAVVGLGGVGGYIAASLNKTSHEVVGFARGKHLQEIQKNGIKIIEDEKEWSTTLDVKTLNEAKGSFDIVLFCVKSYDLKDSYQALKQHVNSKTIIVSFSNGVEHGDTLRKISTCRVLDGCVYILSHIHEAGVIRKKGKVFAAIFGGLQNETLTLKSIFDEAELRAKTPDDIKTAIWKKYIFISAFATTTSFYNNTIGYVYKNHFDEVEAILKEIASLAKAKEIDISQEVQKSLDTAKGLPFDASTSMYLDFKNKKRDELKSLSGYIVEEGIKSSIQTPRMTKMYNELLKRHID